MLAETTERHELRAALDAQLPTDPELDAFLVDFFPDVHRRCSSGMERTAKVNLLFTAAAADEIAEKLRLRPKREHRPAIDEKRRSWQLPIVAIVALVPLVSLVALGAGWLALHLSRKPPAAEVSPALVFAKEDGAPIFPHVTTYKDLDEVAERQSWTLKQLEAELVKINETRLEPVPKSGLRILSYHWKNKKEYPPILDVLIENKTKSEAIITSVNANIMQYYPYSTDADGDIQKEIAIIDIYLPAEAGNHRFYLDDPVRINSGKTGRIKFRFSDDSDMSSPRPLKKPLYKFELGINMADKTVLVISNLALFRDELPR